MSTETTQHNPKYFGRPINTEFLFKLQKITKKDDETIEDILHLAAEKLHGLAVKATIQLRLIQVDETVTKSVFSMQLSPTGVFLQSNIVTKPTLLIVTTAKTFREIAKGIYSPVQAYLEDKLFLQGDANLGKQVILHLAGRDFPLVEDFIVSPVLTSSDWQPNGIGGGTLSFTGLFFTPFGQVVIHYDWGGGFYEQIVSADDNGEFTTSEPIPCGDFQPGVGVIVDAFDLASQKSTQLYKWSTPC